MRRIRRDRVLVLAFVVSFWLSMLFALTAFAQPSGGFFSSGAQETSAWGRYKRMWNASGAEILEGTVVMIDTVAAAVGPQIPVGKGFKTWDGVVGSTYLICGITVGNIANYEQGYILVDGYHNNALMEATGVTGLSRLRPSLTTAGALAAFAVDDTANVGKPIVGVFHRYLSTTSLRAKVYVNFSGSPFGH